MSEHSNNTAYMRGGASGSLRAQQDMDRMRRHADDLYAYQQKMAKRDREAREAEERRQAAVDAAKMKAVEEERAKLAQQQRDADKAETRRRYDRAGGDPSEEAWLNFWRVEEARILQERIAQQEARTAHPRDYLNLGQ